MSHCPFRSGVISVCSITVTRRIVLNETFNSERDIHGKSVSENRKAGQLPEKRQQKNYKEKFSSYQSRKRTMASPHLSRLYEMFWHLIKTKWISRNNLATSNWNANDRIEMLEHLSKFSAVLSFSSLHNGPDGWPAPSSSVDNDRNKVIDKYHWTSSMIGMCK